MPRTARRRKNARRAAARPTVDAVPPMPFTPFSTAWMAAEAARWTPPTIENIDIDDDGAPHCVCCCHEHTFGRGCPAYERGACRGQGTAEERDLYDWYRSTKPAGYRFDDGFYENPQPNTTNPQPQPNEHTFPETP